MENSTLKVHSIESFGTHDGPGIRMVVFLQGCNLKCLYCQNPDTIVLKGGQVIPILELVERAQKMKTYYSNGGGVTVSGGEPLLQSKQLTPFLEQLKANGIHTNIDTNATVGNEHARKIISELADLVMFDVKGTTAAQFKGITGVDRYAMALENIQLREESKKPFWLRYVLIPGRTNHEENLHWLGQTFGKYAYLEAIEILPFHQLGKHKWEAINETYALKEVQEPTAEELDVAEDILKQYFKADQLRIKR